MNSKKYNRIKLTAGISKTIASFILLFLFVYYGYSSLLTGILSEYTSNNYILFLLFFITVGTVSSIIFFPVNFYTGFYLEHQYNLSNQTFSRWAFENFKALIISLLIALLLLLFFYYSLITFESNWWLPFAIILFLFSVVLARIVPTFILPIFYKLTPIENEDLIHRINNLAKDAGIKVENIYKFDMSKNTKKANAAFTGIGKSKRIILGDTLLENYSNDEIETVIAHELGHYKKKHILKGIVFSTVSSFLTLFLMAKLYEISINWFGFNSISEISALPLLMLWGMLIGIIQNPISNMISRKHEYEADRYAIDSTGKVKEFIAALEKLTEQNLGDKEPHPFIEWFFYSHPSIKKRIEAIN